MFISGIYSLNDEINHTESGLSTSAVDIELKEYNANNEPFAEDGKMVLPGEEISLIPRVNNLGIDCYLRASITYTIDGEVLNELDYITGNYSSWNKNGNYYYYDSIFGKEQSIDLFNKVVIPNVSAEAYNGKHVVLHIVVEAIQSRNFDGDWDSVEIKESVDRTYDINYDGSSSVIYDHDTYKHIKIRDNFFGNLGNMLPGDSIEEEVVIRNTSNDKNEYFMAIDYDEVTSDELKLLSKIKMLVTDEKGNVIVDSNLSDKTRYSLGVFDHGLGNKYIIKLSLPTNIDNEYSKLFAKVRWNFSYEVITHRDNIPINPRTGDFKFILSITVFVISAIGFLVVLILLKKNTENIEKNKRKEEKI